MKLREKIFVFEFLTFLFLALGIAGNCDLGIETSIRNWIILIVFMLLTFLQMFYIEIKNRKEE